MPATYYRAGTLGMLVGLVLSQGCAPSAPSSPARISKPSLAKPSASATAAELRTMVDDSHASIGPDRITYNGHWEHATNHTDGRSLGTSSRSFHLGDRVDVDFTGTQIRVYGVRGWKGGYGSVVLDRRSVAATPDFYAPRVQPDALVYESPVLPAGHHTLSILVTGRREAASKGPYVNIDHVAITSAAAVHVP